MLLAMLSLVQILLSHADVQPILSSAIGYPTKCCMIRQVVLLKVLVHLSFSSCLSLVLYDLHRLHIWPKPCSAAGVRIDHASSAHQQCLQVSNLADVALLPGMIVSSLWHQHGGQGLGRNLGLKGHRCSFNRYTGPGHAVIMLLPAMPAGRLGSQYM